jgi:hypothetical protein
MHLERLIYRSKAVTNLGHLHLFYLMSQTCASNRRRGITGLLQYDQGVFTQYIEGPDDAVEALWQRIQQDPRHTQLELIRREPCIDRRFRDWTMSFEVSPGFARLPMRGFIPLERESGQRLLNRCLA